jgi:hypothetical protein
MLKRPAMAGEAAGGRLDELEALIRLDYERARPGDTLEDLKRRARFSKRDKGLLGDWLAVARRRAAARRAEPVGAAR